MFIDRLLGNWDQLLKDYNYEPIRINGIGDNTWESVRNKLKEAVAFNLYNISDYVRERWHQFKFDLSEIPNVRPPYNVMWLEYKNPFENKIKLRIQKLDNTNILPGELA